jgi:hypothetical protein
MNNEHTPGPWIVQGPHDAPWVATPDCRTILPQTVADARLIAAAPDMLRALLDIRDSSAYCAASKARAATAIDKATKP